MSKCREEINALLEILRNVFENALIAAYLHGSAALGGLKKDSDIDVLAVVDCTLSNDMRSVLTSQIMKISGRFKNAQGKRCLELTIVKQNDIVSWQHPAKLQYQYGEWLRDDFERGWISPTQEDPDLTIVLCQAMQHSVTLLGEDISALMKPIPREDLLRAMKDCLPALVNNLQGDERNVLLTLARMWATAGTGEFMTKDKAALWAVERIPGQYGALLNLAASAYQGEYSSDWQEEISKAEQLVTFLQREIIIALQT